MSASGRPPRRGQKARQPGAGPTVTTLIMYRAGGGVGGEGVAGLRWVVGVGWWLVVVGGVMPVHVDRWGAGMRWFAEMEKAEVISTCAPLLM